MRLTVQQAAGGAGTPGGANTNVQFNDSGAFGGDTLFLWDKTNNRLTLNTTTSTETLNMDGSIRMLATSWFLGASGTVALGGISIGTGNTANKLNSVAIGVIATATGDSSVAIGDSTDASANYTIAAGYNALASADSAAAFGRSAEATGASSTAVGLQAVASDSATTAIGYQSSAINPNDTAVGAGAAASGTSSTAVGQAMVVSGVHSAGVGYDSAISADDSYGMGYQLNVGHSQSVAIGLLATTTAMNQMMVGSSSFALDTSIYGGLKVNIGSGNYDTQIQGDTDANALYVDASTDFVGVGTATPQGKFDIDAPDVTGATGETQAFRVSTQQVQLANATALVQWRQSMFYIPILNGIAGGGTESITTAATVAIEGAPSGSNITITNPYSLWVQAGTSRFDGTISAAGGGTSVPSISMPSTSLLTVPAAGAIEKDANVFYSTPIASARGVSPSIMFSIVPAGDFTLSAASGVQSAFPTTGDVWTLAGSTTYEFWGQYHITTGTTSHTTAMAFALAGGASVTSIGYWAAAANGQDNTYSGAVSTGNTWVSQVASTVVTGAVTTGAGHFIYFRGLIRMNAGGTVTPQIAFSANPTGTNLMKASSYICFMPLGTNTANILGNVA